MSDIDNDTDMEIEHGGDVAKEEAKEGDVVMLISPHWKRFFVRLSAGGKLHTDSGVISHDDLLGQPTGRTIHTHMGVPFHAFEPSTFDLMMRVRRNTQIVYPKEAGLILLKMNVYGGRRVIEAGTGSGSLTIALARAVAPGGRVYSYEAREEMQKNALRNVRRAGLDGYVEFMVRDISEGFDERGVDAVFLDVREPWLYLSHVGDALKMGGFFGALLPTTNQVSDLLTALEAGDYGDVEVMEMLMRGYKPVPQRLRPMDTMVGHTGYLVFARRVAGVPSPPPEEEASKEASEEAEEEQEG